jgi:hypothetical protein
LKEEEDKLERSQIKGEKQKKKQRFHTSYRSKSRP